MAAGRLYRINGSLEEGIHEWWHKFQADKHREENEGGTNKIKTIKKGWILEEYCERYNV